jgi:choloylglycine hydrolase
MKQMVKKYIASLLVFITISASLYPCTGITLKSADGGVVVSRTVEWALNDAQHNKILIVPRNKQFIGQTPEGIQRKEMEGQIMAL